MRSFILEINLRLKPVERRVLRSTYVHKSSEPYFVEQSVVWFGVKNRTNHFYFYFYFFCYGHLESQGAIFSEPENTHTKDTSAVRKSKILPKSWFWWPLGWFRPRRAFQRRSIKADPRLSVIRPWLTILCTPTLYLHSAPKRSNVKHTNSRSKTC